MSGERPPLPPYSGNTQCPKCGAGVKTTWHPCGMGDKNFPCLRGGVHIREHLCRTCPRCGYGWIEATVDQEPVLKAIPDA